MEHDNDISTDRSPTNGAHQSSDIDRVRERVTRLAAALRLSHADLAEAIDYSKSAVSRWMRGEQARATPDLDAAMRSWLDEQDRALRAPVEFLETPTSRRILGALAHTQSEADLGCIYGSPGVGKTRAIEHYRSNFANVWVATMTPDSATLIPALEEVAEAVGIHDMSGGARRLARAIGNKVRDLNGLLVIDEAQHLNLSAIESIRGIHDRVGVGLALVGNELVYARMSGGSRAVYFAQLFSRIGVKLYVRKPERRDVRAMTERAGVKDPKALELLDRIAQQPGALRVIVKILRLASAHGGAITVDRVRAAMDNLGAEDI